MALHEGVERLSGVLLEHLSVLTEPRLEQQRDQHRGCCVPELLVQLDLLREVGSGQTDVASAVLERLAARGK